MDEENEKKGTGRERKLCAKEGFGFVFVLLSSLLPLSQDILKFNFVYIQWWDLDFGFNLTVPVENNHQTVEIHRKGKRLIFHRPITKIFCNRCGVSEVV